MVSYDYTGDAKRNYGSRAIAANLVQNATLEAKYGTKGDPAKLTRQFTDFLDASVNARFTHSVPPDARRALEKAKMQIREAMSPDEFAKGMLGDDSRSS